MVVRRMRGQSKPIINEFKLFFTLKVFGHEQQAVREEAIQQLMKRMKMSRENAALVINGFPVSINSTGLWKHDQ